ncbi:MAG: hypothetical protein VYA34_03280 [Myxococcota bacterium]|nr:hypothetical protein [Myxococcota bacterium]
MDDTPGLQCVQINNANGILTVYHQTGAGCSLVSWFRDDGKLLRQEFTYQETLIEHEPPAEVRTAAIYDPQDLTADRVPQPTIQFSPHPATDKLKQALALLLNLDHYDPAIIMLVRGLNNYLLQYGEGYRNLDAMRLSPILPLRANNDYSKDLSEAPSTLPPPQAPHWMLSFLGLFTGLLLGLVLWT